ncbi:MAG: Mu-like prophage major head subunit gpT family protein [Planctomycetaceae bacterium]|jgi:phage major head subunit gpT-like protein|nr:Mu-like prophage major head subunit gpT family protein [Planctomycetaceae bacterium]
MPFIKLITQPIEFNLETAADDGDNKGTQKLPTFKLNAYTGSTVRQYGIDTIIDTKGIKYPSQKLPVRFQHDPMCGIGHTTTVKVENNAVTCEGVISRDNEWTKEILTAAKNGFDWQVSIGGEILEYQWILPDETVEVNGRTIKGEALWIKKLNLREVSFVDAGADAKTSATIALDANFKIELEPTNFKRQMPNTKVKLNTENTNAVVENNAETSMENEQPKNAEVNQNAENANAMQNAVTQQTELANELSEGRRISAIKLYADGKEIALQAQAIAEGWTLTKFQAEFNKKNMPNANQIIAGHEGNAATLSAETLEVIGLRCAGVSLAFIEKKYNAKNLELSDKYVGCGLQEFIELASGKRLPRFRAEPKEWLKAAFSSVSLPNILSNIANKTLLEGFESVDDTWKKIAHEGSVNDFKKHTRYRMTGQFDFQKVDNGGELKHGKLGEEQFSQKIDTFGIMFSLTRQMIIDDDLGAFAEIPRMIGLGAGDAITENFWKLLTKANVKAEDGKNYFSADHKNLLETTPLSYDGIAAAESKFAEQERQAGKPLGISAKFLLVPPALKHAALTLMKSTNLEGTNAINGTANIFAGSYEVLSTPFLQHAKYGNSPSTWYLVADPNRISGIEVAFLDGRKAPTVEQADADFDTLGIQFRGFIDFGIALQDSRAFLKVTA